MGLRLWGMAEEPFWPAAKPSSTSRTSVRCRWRSSTAISSIVAPTDAQAHRYSACRSRAMTCVAGTGVRPSAAHTWRSTKGSTLAYVPTAPDSLPTATASRAERRRVRSRSACRHHRATFVPNVVGSAWTPWVRPIMAVSRWRSAVALSVATSPSDAASSSSAASRSIQHQAVSTTSDDVRP